MLATMRIQLSQVSKWEKIGVPPHVLDFVKNGLTLPWGEGGSPSAASEVSKSKTIAPELKPFVTERIRFMVNTGRLEAAREADDVLYVNPFATSALRQGRLLLNLAPLHKHLAPIPKTPGEPPFFSPDGYLRKHMQAQDWLVKIDLQDGYAHFCVSEKSRPYLGMRWEDRCYRHVAIPHGLSWSTFMFGETMRFLVLYVRENITSNVVNFSDDWLMFGRDYESVQRHYVDVQQLFSELGLCVNLAKSSLEPRQQVDFVGHSIVTSDGLQVGPMEAKIAGILANVQAMKILEEVQIREVACLRGQLIAAVRFGAPTELLSTPNFSSAMAVRKELWGELTSITPEIQAELSQVEEILESMLEKAGGQA